MYYIWVNGDKCCGGNRLCCYNINVMKGVFNMKKFLGLLVSLSMIVSGCYLIYDSSFRQFVDEKKMLDSSDSVRIGDEAVNKDGVTFCVTKVNNSKSLGKNHNMNTDYNFVTVSIKITNNSTEPYDVNPLNFTLIEGDKEFEHTNEALLVMENVMFLDTINPSLSNEYILVYETTTTTDDSEYKLKIKRSAFSKVGNTYITLKEVG